MAGLGCWPRSLSAGGQGCSHLDLFQLHASHPGWGQLSHLVTGPASLLSSLRGAGLCFFRAGWAQESLLHDDPSIDDLRVWCVITHFPLNCKEWGLSWTYQPLRLFIFNCELHANCQPFVLGPVASTGLSKYFIYSGNSISPFWSTLYCFLLNIWGIPFNTLPFKCLSRDISTAQPQHLGNIQMPKLSFLIAFSFILKHSEF